MIQSFSVGYRRSPKVAEVVKYGAACSQTLNEAEAAESPEISGVIARKPRKKIARLSLPCLVATKALVVVWRGRKHMTASEMV